MSAILTVRRLAAIVLFAYASAASAQLPPPVSKMLADAKIPEDAMAALVIRLPDAKTVLAHRETVPMRPASTMKLVTTMVGLEHLGPVFRGRTELRTNAPLTGDILRDHVSLRGGADADFNWEALEKMLQTMRNQGIRHIEGDLIVDRNLFFPARPELGVPPFDETPEFAYNVIPDALLLNQNLQAIEIESTDTGIKVRATPQLEGVTVDTDMSLIDGPCPDWEDGWKLPTVSNTGAQVRITLHGTYPRNCARATAINMLDRTLYAHRLVRALWTKLGGTWNGGVREGDTPPNTRILAEHQSRPLADVLRDINKQSDNTLARLLYLSIGKFPPDPAVAAGTVSTARSEQVVRAWFKRNGIADEGMVIENGSGLSRIERISPLQMAGLLKVAANSNWAPEFASSLPIAAVDGTMRRRLKDSPAAQRARVKTGTLRDTVAIAGYVKDAAGVPYIVAAMINSDTAKPAVARPVIDALLDWVARQP
ncbi:MAG TPA: D-alanyl-D-alanine carboxypeptidase/D-alanyl-D-alanine-endopeptidase [Burkholderiaceae bacterium]